MYCAIFPTVVFAITFEHVYSLAYINRRAVCQEHDCCFNQTFFVGPFDELFLCVLTFSQFSCVHGFSH